MVALDRALYNNGGQAAAFTYVLQYIDPDTGIGYPETPQWHLPSEFLRRQRACWQLLNAANELEPLSVVDEIDRRWSL